MDANAQWVTAGTALLGTAAGVLGALALLRRRALMGDVLAHAALPGIAAAFLLTGSKAPGPLLTGAAVAGVVGTGAMAAITRYSRLKEDAAMSLVLTVFFGMGIMLLGVVQRMPGGNQSGLDTFLFGQAAAIVPRDLQAITLMAGALCLMVLALYKEFKLLAFDREFGAGLGLPMGRLDLLLNLGLVLAVVTGLESVGVVLMAALLTTPALAARCWTDRLSTMLPLAGLFGALSGVAGTLLSQVGPRMPTGPLIVLAATFLFAVSLLAAPRRGLVARLIRMARTQARVRGERLLEALYDLSEEAASTGAPTVVTLADLEQRRGLSARWARPTLMRLVRAGMVERAGLTDPGGPPAGEEPPAVWRLTPRGLAEAYRVAHRERLHVVYLMHQAAVGGPFGPEVYPQLEPLLRLHGLEPRLLPGEPGEGVG